MNTFKYATAAGSAALGLIFGNAPASQADQWDYLSYLDDNGVAYSTVSGVISLGKDVCHELRGGTSLRVIGRYLMGPLGYTPEEAGHIVVGAAGGMCPDVIPALEAHLDDGTSTDQVA